MDTPLGIGTALVGARARGLDRLDAQLLLGHVLGRSRAWLLAHGDETLAPAQAAMLQALVTRRAAGEPLAYLVGEQEFRGLALQVDARVLIPRPDTEVLVDWALELLAGRSAPRVVDLGTGSGAIALAVKHACPGASMVATDLSPAALQVATANAGRLGLAVEFRAGGWWAAVGATAFDLVLSNPPYIAGDDHHLAALKHEPRQALTPGGDGLDALRALVAGAREHLRPSGWILLEHGYDQAPAVQTLLADAGLVRIETRTDLGGQPRCTGATLARESP